MSDGLPTRSLVAGAGFLVFMAGFFVMLELGFHRTALMVPLAAALAATLVGLRPLVEGDKVNALYFALGVMAFMLLFLHETYGLAGKERDFPLIIGYIGVAFSALDIASVTDTAVGRFVTRFFASALDPAEIKPRAVSRELLVFAVMGLAVLAIWLFGFLIASPLFVFLWMLIGGGKSLKLSLYVGLGTLAFIYGLFEMVLQYDLYPGVVVTWFLETYFE